MQTTLLAIETTCDDTALAVVRGSFDSTTASPSYDFDVLCDVRASQTALHTRTGGVVPEVAARAHVEAFTPLLDEAVARSGVALRDLDGLCVANMPGLIPSLMVGLTAARSLSYALTKSLLGVHHIEGHVLSPLLGDDSVQLQKAPFPWLVLTASGGHTLFTIVHDIGHYESLGGTRDDAAGEAFDKAAKMLGLGYPGGPALSKYAAGGNTAAFDFPRPMSSSDDYDVSFSGLKTAFALQLKELGVTAANARDNMSLLSDLCASYQMAIIETMTVKIERALGSRSFGALAVAGGVSANTVLRDRVAAIGASYNVLSFVAPLAYTTDNAAMIGLVGLLRMWRDPALNKQALRTQWRELGAAARGDLISWAQSS